MNSLIGTPGDCFRGGPLLSGRCNSTCSPHSGSSLGAVLFLSEQDPTSVSSCHGE